MYTNWMHLERQSKQCTQTEYTWRDRASNVHKLNAPGEKDRTMYHLFVHHIRFWTHKLLNVLWFKFHTRDLYKTLHGYFYFHKDQHHRSMSNGRIMPMPRVAYMCKKKVKVTLVQALRLCTGRTARRGSRAITLPFLDHGTRRGRVVSITPWPLFTPGKKPGTHCTRGWVGPRAGLDRCQKSCPPLGFDPQNVQPVVSRYTDYTTQPAYMCTPVKSSFPILFTQYVSKRSWNSVLLHKCCSKSTEASSGGKY
jgi:hypothetical protein